MKRLARFRRQIRAFIGWYRIYRNARYLRKSRLDVILLALAWAMYQK